MSLQAIDGRDQKRSTRRTRPYKPSKSLTPPAPKPALASIVVPTYNEAGNVSPLLERLGQALADCHYEIILVDDDSPDGTWQLAEQAAGADDRITVIRRRGQRGLSSAIMAGMTQAAGDVIVVIDADLQHDEQRIPDLISEIIDTHVDVCVGTRSGDGGDYGAFARRRRLISWSGATLARLLLNVQVSDPMSGFFAISRHRFELLAAEVDPRGFKILLEFLARGPRPMIAEVGYRFGERHSGTTKLSGTVVVDYLKALSALAAYRVRRRAETSRSRLAS